MTISVFLSTPAAKTNCNLSEISSRALICANHNANTTGSTTTSMVKNILNALCGALRLISAFYPCDTPQSRYKGKNQALPTVIKNSEFQQRTRLCKNLTPNNDESYLLIDGSRNILVIIKTPSHLLIRFLRTINS